MFEKFLNKKKLMDQKKNEELILELDKEYNTIVKHKPQSLLKSNTSRDLNSFSDKGLFNSYKLSDNNQKKRSFNISKAKNTITTSSYNEDNNDNGLIMTLINKKVIKDKKSYNDLNELDKHNKTKRYKSESSYINKNNQELKDMELKSIDEIESNLEDTQYNHYQSGKYISQSKPNFKIKSKQETSKN